MSEAPLVTPHAQQEEVRLQVEESLRRLQAVHEISEDMLEHDPDFAGITVYGSTVRGESKNRDVDMYAFFEVPERQEDAKGSRAEKYVDGGMNVYQFDFSTNFVRKITLQRALREKGVEEADVDVLAINEDIVADQIHDLIDQAAKNAKIMEQFKDDPERRDREFKMHVPRNIRALFQLPVGQDKLHKYQRQVVDALSASPDGKMAWAMIWYRATHFEKGRGNPYDGVHRRVGFHEIPDTLAKAYQQYGVESSVEEVPAPVSASTSGSRHNERVSPPNFTDPRRQELLRQIAAIIHRRLS